MQTTKTSKCHFGVVVFSIVTICKPLRRGIEKTRSEGESQHRPLHVGCGGVSGGQMFPCVLGRQGMDLGVGVVFVLKFSSISALGKALPMHEQWL